MRTDGVWSITTETGSVYMFDLDKGTVLRMPDQDVPTHADLRHDLDTLELLGMVGEPAVDKPLVMVLQPLDSEAFATVRMTSRVTEIRELSRD